MTKHTPTYTLMVQGAPHAQSDSIRALQRAAEGWLNSSRGQDCEDWRNATRIIDNETGETIS